MKLNAITVGDLAVQRHVLDLTESLTVCYDIVPGSGADGDDASTVDVTCVDGSAPAPLQERWARALVGVVLLTDQIHLRLRRN